MNNAIKSLKKWTFVHNNKFLYNPLEKCFSHFSSTYRINMKVFILAATLALAQACTDNPAAKCGTTDQVCPGGIDPMGCAMPDFCVPADSKYIS